MAIIKKENDTGFKIYKNPPPDPSDAKPIPDDVIIDSGYIFGIGAPPDERQLYRVDRGKQTHILEVYDVVDKGMAIWRGKLALRVIVNLEGLERMVIS